MEKRGRFYKWLASERLIAGRWSQDDIAVGGAVAMHEALMPLMEWWLDYEEWICERCGKAHREACYAEWKKVKGGVQICRNGRAQGCVGRV